MREANWQEYYKNTESTPRSLLVKAVDLITNEKDEALDLGAGSLRDSRFLLSIGFKQVTAVDKTKIGKEILSEFKEKPFSYYVDTFENFDFEENKYDLINAQNSLPFNPRESFSKVFTSIVRSLKPEGIFVGNFFGERDEWNTGDDQKTFHTKSEIESLFSRFEILEFEESEKDGPTASGQIKHWHIFEIIARKV